MIPECFLREVNKIAENAGIATDGLQPNDPLDILPKANN